MTAARALALDRSTAAGVFPLALALARWSTATRVVALVLCIALRSTAATAAGETASRPTKTPPQSLRAEDVRIEGKLYSPQALFIVSRPEESFGRDVLPHYLKLDPSGRLLPYRLRPEFLPAHGAAVVPTIAPDSLQGTGGKESAP